MKEYLIIGNSRELFRIATEDILYVLANGNYSVFYFTYGDTVNMTLSIAKVGEYINELCPQTSKDFVRVGRSLIINLSHLHYINFSDEKLVLLDRNKDKTVVEAPIKALRELASRIKNEVKPDN